MERCGPILVFVAALASGQEFRSTISGLVTDPQMSAIPGARITATQVDTGSRTETVSGGDGRYSLPFLLPGAYRITVEAEGFKRHMRDGIDLSANERKTVDIPLEIGLVAENVTVTADAPLLDTATASIGMVINPRQVEYMPLNGRTPLMLAQLSAGVISLTEPGITRPFDNNNPANFSVSGAPTRTNELLMDGTPNATRDSRSAYNPPMDSVAELKIEAFQADAAFGNTGGGTVNVVSKAGGNQFHGTAYHYNQVSRLGATPFFNNRAGQKKPVFLWNQYGVTAGGPVLIPRLFSGKDRLFFYFAFEGIKQPNLAPLTATVPTEAMRRGDFSQLLRVGSNYQIYDPYSGVREGARVRRQPFAGNVIPSSLLSPVAQKLTPFWPLPNQTGGADGRSNLFVTAPGPENYDNEFGRLDFNASTRHKMFFNFRRSLRFNTSQVYFDNIARGRNLGRESWGGVFDDVYTFTPTLLLNTRVGWTRFVEERRVGSAGFDPTTLGLPAYIAANSQQLMLPRFDIGGFERLGESNHAMIPFDSFQIFSNATKILNRHNLKFGVDLRLYRESNYEPGNATGRYQFSTNWTRGPLDSAAAAPLGQEFAAFMLGLPTGGSYDLISTRTNQAGYWALFLQDDFRVSSSLTLNLGIRYERELPTTERFNRILRGFDPDAATTVTAAARAAYARAPIPEVPVAQFNPTGGFLFATPEARSPYATAARNFSPRFGFAWTPPGLGGKTVLRGGAGVFFFDLGLTGLGQPGFSFSTPLVSTQDGYLTPYASLSNPFPDGIARPPGASLGVNTLLGQTINFFNPRPASPYSTRWNFNIQRLLSRDLVVEAGYIGNRSIKLGVDRPLNYVPLDLLSTSPVRDQAAIDRLSANVANPFAGLLPGTSLNGGVVSRTQLLGRFPHFTGATLNGGSDGSTYSHILLIRSEKRFSRGLQLQGSFQYSRIIQRMSRLNDADTTLEKRIAVEDRPLRVVVSGTYAFPFGRGQRFGGGVNRVLNQVIGGWSGAGFYSFQSGIPVDWGNLIYYGGDLNWQPTNVDRAFDVTRFNTNSREQLAQNRRTFPTAFSGLRGDVLNNFDLSVIKDFPIVERLRLQYRCEFFNALNHPLFDRPDVNAVNSTFGRIQNQYNLPRRIQMALRLVW